MTPATLEIRKSQPGIVTVSETSPGGDYRYVAKGIDDLAEWLDVTPQTVRRWCRGAPIPRTVQHALRLLMGRFGSDDWQEFVVLPQDGRLWGPGMKRGFNPRELANWMQVHDHVLCLQAENEQLRADLEQLRQQPPVVVVQSSSNWITMLWSALLWRWIGDRQTLSSIDTDLRPGARFVRGLFARRQQQRMAWPASPRPGARAAPLRPKTAHSEREGNS